MRKRMCLLLGVAVAITALASCAPAPKTAAPSEFKFTAGSMQEAHDFLKRCGNYYIATVDGDRPQVRPFGSAAIFEGRLYFITSNQKNVAKQMAANPNVAICAYDGAKWLRISAVAVMDDRRAARAAMLEAQPELNALYSADDGIAEVWYLTNAAATVSSWTEATQEFNF